MIHDILFRATVFGKLRAVAVKRMASDRDAENAEFLVEKSVGRKLR